VLSCHLPHRIPASRMLLSLYFYLFSFIFIHGRNCEFSVGVIDYAFLNLICMAYMISEETMKAINRTKKGLQEIPYELIFFIRKESVHVHVPFNLIT